MANFLAPNGAPLPDQPVGRLWTCPPGDHSAVLVGPWVGYWVHWMGKRSMPCGDDACPVSRHRRPAYWVGYAPAYILGRVVQADKAVQQWLPYVVPLTSDHCHQLRAHFKLPSWPARVTFMRRAGSKIVRMVDLERAKPDERYPCYDVMPTLWRVWGVVPPRPAPAPDAQDFATAEDFERAQAHGERNGRPL